MDAGTVHGYQDDGTECSEALYKSLGFCQFANSIGGMYDFQSLLSVECG